MRPFKLKLVGLSTISDCSIVFNQHDFPDAQDGDMVEIYQQDCVENRVLFKARILSDNQQKLAPSNICISTAVAKKHNLLLNREVLASIVQPSDVAIELLEVIWCSH